MSIGSVKVLFVCHGNICRSPMAEFIFKRLVEERGLSSRFHIASAGTSGEQIGDPPDSRAASALSAHGISCAGKTSKKLILSDFLDYDYLVCMDESNMQRIRVMCPSDYACEISKLMDHSGGGNVDDPYWTGDFEKTFEDVTRGCEGLLEHIMEKDAECVQYVPSSQSRYQKALSSIKSALSWRRVARGRPRRRISR